MRKTPSQRSLWRLKPGKMWDQRGYWLCLAADSWSPEGAWQTRWVWKALSHQGLVFRQGGRPSLFRGFESKRLRFRSVFSSVQYDRWRTSGAMSVGFKGITAVYGDTEKILLQNSPTAIAFVTRNRDNPVLHTSEKYGKGGGLKSLTALQ